MKIKKILRIVLSSPNDVEAERRVMESVVEELNRGVAADRNLRLELSLWETDAYPGFHAEGPQGLIDPILKIEDCDILLGIFWKRFGTPTKEAQSGTEHEIRTAIKSWEQRKSPQIMIYFKEEKFYSQKRADFEQFDRVLSFREEFPKEGLYWTFEDVPEFEKLARNHLTNFIRLRFDRIVEESESSLPQPGPSSVSDLDVEISAYCKKAEALHATMPVAGFATQLKVPIDIEEIYIPLHAMLDLRGVADEAFLDADHAEKALQQRDAGLEISIPDAFRQSEQRDYQGIVILGDPGSGKTTHLKRLLLWCLRGGPETIGLPAGMLPVFLPLRNLNKLDQGLDVFIQQQLADKFLKTAPGFGERLLQRENLLLLLDGLDEVADPDQRQEVGRWIMDALQYHRSCRFVVTCRFAGYIPKVRLGENFLEMHLRPLTEAQVEAFIHNWYTIVEKGLAKDTEQAEEIAREKAAKLVNRLKESDFRVRRVFELTRNPLLLTNICLVHRYRGGLPQKRARLYEECIDVLLEHWRAAKELPVGVTAQDGMRALQPAALWLHQKEERTRAKAAELAPHIEPVLKALDWPGGAAEDFLRTIRDDSGLLTGWDIENYGFMHLGFQEYLAAREIRSRALAEDQTVIPELASHFGDSWWQEVGLLLLALEDPSLFVRYMREVVKLPAFAKFPALVRLCLDDATEKYSQPFVELLEIAPRDDEDLWKRQLVALRILERLDPAEVETHQQRLLRHPSLAIRQWFQERIAQTALDVVTAKRGGYELVKITGGDFMMGSPKTEAGHHKSEHPFHQVRIPEFYLGRYPVTNEEYGQFLKENADNYEPRYWADRRFNQLSQPVIGVSWDDAKRYAEWASLRLPSEAEWEYACRANTKTQYYTGDTEKDLDRAGWYGDNSGGELHPVGEKDPNAYGLYDMHGNVFEWVEDDWHVNYVGAPDDGGAWIDKPRGAVRVIRGGGWDSGASICRSAIRYYGWPGRRRLGHVGFRLARSVALGP